MRFWFRRAISVFVVRFMFCGAVSHFRGTVSVSRCTGQILRCPVSMLSHGLAFEVRLRFCDAVSVSFFSPANEPRGRVSHFAGPIIVNICPAPGFGFAVQFRLSAVRILFLRCGFCPACGFDFCGAVAVRFPFRGALPLCGFGLAARFRTRPRPPRAKALAKSLHCGDLLSSVSAAVLFWAPKRSF